MYDTWPTSRRIEPWPCSTACKQPLAKWSGSVSRAIAWPW